MKLFPIILWGHKTLKENLKWYQTILLKDGGARKWFYVQDGVWIFLCEIILRPGTQDKNDCFFINEPIDRSIDKHICEIQSQKITNFRLPVGYRCSDVTNQK